MRTVTAAVTLLLVATSAHAGLSGTASYSWDLSSSTASLGDTVSVTLIGEFTPSEMPFFALAESAFDIEVDDIVGGGSIGGRALHPSFASLGSLGTIESDGITDVSAVQFPAVETASTLELFTFEYTVDIDTPRMVEFSLANETNSVYTSGGFPPDVTSFVSESAIGQLEVIGVPAPGALALLGLAGLVGRRGRKRRHIRFD